MSPNKIISLAFACVLFTSCATGPRTLTQLPPQQPSPGSAVLYLAEEVFLPDISGDKAVLPKGHYHAISQATNGLYYQAEVNILFTKAAGTKGGVFIPSDSNEPQQLWVSDYAFLYYPERQAQQDLQAARENASRFVGTQYGGAAAIGLREAELRLAQAQREPSPQRRVIYRYPHYVLRKPVPFTVVKE